MPTSILLVLEVYAVLEVLATPWLPVAVTAREIDSHVFDIGVYGTGIASRKNNTFVAPGLTVTWSFPPKIAGVLVTFTQLPPAKLVFSCKTMPSPTGQVKTSPPPPAFWAVSVGKLKKLKLLTCWIEVAYPSEPVKPT